jgi:hypothetical protein
MLEVLAATRMMNGNPAKGVLMIGFRRLLTSALLVAAVALVAFQSSARANNWWGGYHWARTANPFTIALADNLSADWDGYLTTASADWTKSSVLDTTIVQGTKSPRQCKPTAGRVEVCNEKYGLNGWLGIASVWASGSHITQGTVKLNDSYFSLAKYNTPDWKQLVTCQEIGHTFGLDHQDENFNNANLGTCMDYTNLPASNTHPNQHDYDELAYIYSTFDSFTTVGKSTGAAAAAPGASDNPAEWGQLMKVSRGGKLQVFERDFGNGQKVITFVIWA